MTAMILLVAGCVMQSVNSSDLAEKSRTLLSDQVKNGSRDARETVVRLTGGMVESEAVPLLQVALNDPESNIVKKTIEKLIEIKNPLAEPSKRKDLADRFDPDLIDTLIDLGAKDLDANIELGLTSTLPVNRARAVELLGKYKGEEAEERIRTFLNDEDSTVVLRTKVALARLGDEEVTNGLEQYLDSQYDIEKLAAVTFIGEKDLKQYKDKLLEIANLKQGLLSTEAMRVLYKWDVPDVSEMYKEEISEKLQIIKFPILKDIEEKKDKNMIDALRKAMASSVPNIRYSTARIAITIDPENTKDVLDFMLKGMDSEDSSVREQVAISISQLPGIPVVKEILEKKGIKDKEAKVVNASIVALGKVGNEKTLSHLAPLLDSNNSETRVSAAAAILNIINRENLKGKSPETESKESSKDESKTQEENK